jgi:hypothetical protein
LNGAEVFPNTTSAVDVECLLVLNKVGESLSGGLRKVRGCGDSTLVVKARTRSALRSSWTCGACVTSGTLGTRLTLWPLWANNALVPVQKNGVETFSGRWGRKDGVSVLVETLVRTISDEEKFVRKVDGELTGRQEVRDLSRDKTTTVLKNNERHD